MHSGSAAVSCDSGGWSPRKPHFHQAYTLNLMQHLWNKVIPSFFFFFLHLLELCLTYCILTPGDAQKPAWLWLFMMQRSLMKLSAAFINSTVRMVMTRSVEWGLVVSGRKNRKNYHVRSGPKKGFVWLVHYQAVCVQIKSCFQPLLRLWTHIQIPPPKRCLQIASLNGVYCRGSTVGLRPQPVYCCTLS